MKRSEDDIEGDQIVRSPTRAGHADVLVHSAAPAHAAGQVPRAAAHAHRVHIPAEPVHPTRPVHPQPARPAAVAAQAPARPQDVEALVTTVQQAFPDAAIRITGRGRTVEQQARLMAQRRLANRRQFLNVYRPAAHITAMDQWVTDNPEATEADATAAYQGIIADAQRRGATVSNHIGNRARDISVPRGTPAQRAEVRQRLQQLGGHVIDEHDAVGGAHWHVDY